jgi:predicted ATP-dependent endonuclease of OLD family
VRLHPAHAAALFALVRGHGMNRTAIVVSGSLQFAARRW